ncbi:putative K+-dependent Na+/Ca+ exchanger protein [Crocosphaera subtropica ATCC 51142]|uniref:K+-dependent Na+/Ca+ exchanger protein n=1 Tax=Crocosphaera subtropica (strain ATCC 51142 / BH68) TaxID=43989 RepID=B1WQJ1_CROS5|nr:calcium/sodium antiporter [Crocosphaera subtropica]ACB51702.1 putative K+-dependent Na+/Ca+ exchanger protein [Crocosphaera subtropica ATCC 51142]
MNFILVFGLLVAGLVLLVVGAEILVRGAARLAASLGISPLVIGLTIVSYGTSSPEMAVAVQSSLAGQADLALGNVIGSNIFNILVILGLSSIAIPLMVAQQLIRLDVPIMIGVFCLTLFFGLDRTITRSDGIILLIGGAIYTGFLIYQGSRQSSDPDSEYETEYGNKTPLSLMQWIKNIAFILLGVGCLVLGSQWLVDSATTIARQIGVSDLIIGLTIVAAGTSLPELATSVVAAIKGERDIAVGNVVGSNIFNILTVLALCAIVSPIGVPVSDAVLHFDLPVMVAIAIACLPIFFTGNVIARWEGCLFLAYYLAYTTYLILYATEHDGLSIFSSVMLFFVIPITAITLMILTINSLRKKQQKKQLRNQPRENKDELN